MINEVVTLHDVLKNKEERAWRQKKFLASSLPLVSISINIPGNKKLTHDSIFIYDTLLQELTDILYKKNIQFKKVFTCKEKTGPEALLSIDLDAIKLKKISYKLEETHFLGRFIDIDVIDFKKGIISRKNIDKPSRKCFLCSHQAALCSRSKAHSVHELLAHISYHVKIYKKIELLSTKAKEAMLKEVNLTPKPGLVDKNNSGAHKDMNIDTFYVSIDAIAPYLKYFIFIGFMNKKNNVFEKLRELGIECEKAMFQATKGINTHKGMIFSLAIILGSLGILLKEKKSVHVKNLMLSIQYICSNLIKKDLENKTVFKSAGERYFLQTKNGGIRQEAQEGYPTLFHISLPFLNQVKKTHTKDVALKLTLIKLISTLNDTTLYNRKGKNGLLYAQKKASIFLDKKYNNIDKELTILDEDFIKNNLSPGGSADMLGLTYFLDAILHA